MPLQKGKMSMLKWYKIIYRTLWRDKVMYETSGIMLDEEENVPDSSTKIVDWSTIEKDRDVIFDRGFDVIQCRKGLKIEFWEHIFPVLKQWKSETELRIETEYTPVEVSLERAMAYGDSIKVLKWMLENGLNGALETRKWDK